MTDAKITTQILSQTSENIQKLFDLTTRIDQKMVDMQSDLELLEEKIDGIIKDNNDLHRKVIVLESHNKLPLFDSINSKLVTLEKDGDDLQKRMLVIEHSNNASEDRWGKISSFVIQLVWIVIASWILFKMNLSPPPVP